MRWGIHNLKHPEIWKRYHDYKWLKSSYSVYFNRIIQRWYSKEEAIQPWSMKWKHLIKSFIDENWRQCTICREYKMRFEFAKNGKLGIHGRCWDCKACRKIAKAEYRKKTGGLVDKAYKQRVRNLELWTIVNFPTEMTKDLCELWKIQDRKVVARYFKKWHKLRSAQTWYYRWLDTNDNHKVNPNCIKFIIKDPNV